jgi:hypothetical protein
MGTNLGVSPSQYFFEQSTAVRAFDGTHFVELLTTIPTGLALDPHFLAGVGFMSPGNLSVALLRLDSVDARPSFVAHAGLSAARIPDDAVLTSARLEALAGGQTPQAGTSGTRLLAWLDGRWVEGNDSSANAAPLDAPALMSVELTDRELRQATLYRRELGFAVETRGRSTLGQPVTMRVDWARASLRFRRRAP